MPEDIGKTDPDSKAMSFAKHMAIGVNADYEYVTTKAPGAPTASVQNNNFDVREIEIYPLVGSFFGNFGTFTEVDFTPNLTSAPGTPTVPGQTTPSTGSVNLNMADLRYVVGTPDLFFNARVGLIAAEGYGASDQWVDDGNLPLFDLLTAQYNQDTLVLPFGAMGVPQVGVELGANYCDSHLTLGIYNGYDGNNGLAAQVPSTLSPATINQGASGSKDVKLQLDQFFGNDVEATLAYYHGTMALLDPTNQFQWTNHFDSARAYLTYSILPNQVDLLGGMGYGNFQYVQPGSATVAGNFQNRGAFLGANYYVMPHLTLSTHVDYYQYNLTAGSQQQATGISLMVSIPFENNLFIIHYDNLGSDVTGITNDFRLEWRFLF
jgi:hypothetical protein